MYRPFFLSDTEVFTSAGIIREHRNSPAGASVSPTMSVSPLLTPSAFQRPPPSGARERAGAEQRREPARVGR